MPLIFETKTPQIFLQKIHQDFKSEFKAFIRFYRSCIFTTPFKPKLNYEYKITFLGNFIKTLTSLKSDLNRTRLYLPHKHRPQFRLRNDLI